MNNHQSNQKNMRLLKLNELLKVKNAFNFSKMLSLFVLFGLFSICSVAQNTTISIKTFSETDCSEDQVVRYYTLDKSEKNVSTFNKYYNGTGCNFQITENLAPGTYVLTIFTYEFNEVKVEITISSNQKTINLEPIQLSEKVGQLEEIVVYDRKKYIKVDSDKTTISVKDNPLISSGTALDAIKKMPGVVASPTGGFTLNGKQISIYIDDSPNSLSGQDLQNYLSSLPAKAIDNIELIYNPGAAFEANSSGSIINLLTSTVRLKGINASFNINYNFNKYQKPSPQILLNGKEKNLSWQTMMGYNYIEAEEVTNNEQTFTSFNPNKNILQQRMSLTTNRNLYTRIGTNYKLTSKSNILLNYNTVFNNDRNDFISKTIGSDIDEYANNGIGKNKGNNHEISLQFRTKLDTLGRKLNLTAYTNFIKNHPINNSNAIENSTTSLISISSDFELMNNYLKYDFIIPFDKLGFSLNTGGKYNNLEVSNLGKYAIASPVTTLINFDYKETNLAFYAEARKKIKKFNFSLGLRLEDFNIDRNAVVEDVNTKVIFKNTNLFPNVSALYQLSDNVNISSSYSRKINQPNYNTLDPNGGTFDQYNTSGGNILLNPVFFDNYEFKISALDFIQVGTNYTVGKDQNFFVFNAEPNELVSSNSFKQFDKVKTFTAYANFPIPLDYIFKGKTVFEERLNQIDKMNYIYLSINYVKTTIEGFDFPFQQKPIVNYGGEAQILLPWNVKSNLNYFLVPRGNWEIYNITKPIQQFDISFNREFLNKKLTLGVHVLDVFNANEVNAVIASSNLNTNFYQKRDSRTFRISLNYNFGNLKLDKENTTIETEKVQTGGGILK